MLPNGLYELLSEGAEPDRIADVESLNDVGGRGRRDGVDIWDRHEDGSRGTRRSIGRHRDVGIGRAERKRVGRVVA